jgi:hypothetical protein
MLQELMEIAEHVKIDQEASTRLEACIDSEFKSSHIRCFIARRAIIVAAAGAPLSIRISGFSESFKGCQLTCSNIANPENLEVSLHESEMVLQSAKDPDILYVKGGITTISGPKYSDVAKDLDTPAGALNILPKRDPDIVQIDQKIFRQTGTVHISGPFYVVILER